TYLNTSTFLGRKTQLTYIVREFIPRERIRLRAENKTVIAVDTMTFRSIDAGTEVTYTAEFTFKGPSRLLAPLLRPAFERLGTKAQAGLRTARDHLCPPGSGRTRATRVIRPDAIGHQQAVRLVELFRRGPAQDLTSGMQR